LATEAMEDDVDVSVVRLPSRSSSMRPTLPKAGLRQRIAPRAQGLVHRILAAAMKDTIVLGREDFDLGPMADGRELLAQAVAADRCQVGDGKRVLSTAAREHAEAAGCPFECRDAHGAKCGLSWLHAASRCQGAEMVAARAKWVERLREAQVPMEKTKPYEPMRRLLRAIGADMSDSSAEAQADASLVIQRATCGFFETGGEDQGYGRGAISALRAARDAGLELQRLAKREAKAVEEELAKLGKGLARARPWARRWLRRARSSGPERAGRLEDLALARR
jgi:hypothetical protein